MAVGYVMIRGDGQARASFAVCAVRPSAADSEAGSFQKVSEGRIDGWVGLEQAVAYCFSGPFVEVQDAVRFRFQNARGRGHRAKPFARE